MITYFTRILEAHPLAGYISSGTSSVLGVSGVTVITMAVEWASRIAGLSCLVLGALGGFYTWRIQRAKWKEAQHGIKNTSPDND